MRQLRVRVWRLEVCVKALLESFVGRALHLPSMSGLNYKGNDKPCLSSSDNSH